MKHHILKTDRMPLNAVISGIKTHEVRVNDRGYKVGDLLYLRDSAYPDYPEIVVEVTYITDGGSYGLPDNLCVMSIRRIQ